MIFRRAILLTLAAAPFALSFHAHSADGTSFSDDAFKNAVASGKPVLVFIHASWCPTCAAQKPILEKLLTEKFKDTIPLVVDFDTQKHVVRALKAQHQSTLIVFRDGAEVGRSVGDTNPASIEALLAKGV